MRTLNVKVQSDHLSKLASVKSPAQALCELIWNGLDADAQKVIVTYKYNTLNAINEISIEDDGHGIFAIDLSIFTKTNHQFVNLKK